MKGMANALRHSSHSADLADGCQYDMTFLCFMLLAEPASVPPPSVDIHAMILGKWYLDLCLGDVDVWLDKQFVDVGVGQLFAGIPGACPPGRSAPTAAASPLAG
jgi:hypothetical protein